MFQGSPVMTHHPLYSLLQLPRKAPQEPPEALAQDDQLLQASHRFSPEAPGLVRIWQESEEQKIWTSLSETRRWLPLLGPAMAYTIPYDMVKWKIGIIWKDSGQTRFSNT
jgi:hypothetical protein